MKHRTITHSPLLLAAALMAATPLATARLLVTTPQAQVHMDGELRCHRGADLRVVARDPTLLAGESPALQALLDATRAMLGFECRNLAGMTVTGQLDGLAGNNYKAVAGPESDWRLQTSRTVAVSALSRPPAPVMASAPPPAEASGRAMMDYTVRDLRRGMSVAEAQRTLRGNFGREPRYEQGRRLMTVTEGGCPVDSEGLRGDARLQPGDTCLQAHFSSDSRERLDEISFGQVVDLDQSATIRTALLERYGPPLRTWRLSPSSTRYVWGRKLSDQDDRYELEARVDVADSSTLLVVDLNSLPRQARHRVNF